ncbi:uncharacterized protein LOC131957048 [Physella acuta]|uniref:uncharacterized protein LOC131957048 n=1 Tax=Physella acuta TaxID=109671 RepID=UPI0027DE1D73|nr:uncharacterized protein LOC131957048 [Physella acuta]
MVSVKPSVKFSPEPDIQEFSLTQVESFDQPLQVFPKHQDAECQILLSPSEDEIRIQLSTKRSKRKLQNKSSQVMRDRLQSISTAPLDITRDDPNFMAGVVVFLETYTQESLENVQAVAMAIQDEKLSNTMVIDRITEILHETLEKFPHMIAGICELIRSTKDPTERRKEKKKRSKGQVRQKKKESKSSKVGSECSIKQGQSLMANKVEEINENKEEVVDEMSTQENISSNRPQQENRSANRPEQSNTISDRPSVSSESPETSKNSSQEDDKEDDKHLPALSSSMTQMLEDLSIKIKVPEGGKVSSMTYTLVNMLLLSTIKRSKGRPLGVDIAASTEEIGSATAALSDEAFEQLRSLKLEGPIVEERISLPPEIQHSEDMLKYLLNKSTTIRKNVADFIESALPSTVRLPSFNATGDSDEYLGGKQAVGLPWASARKSQVEELQKKKSIDHPWSLKSKLLASSPSPARIESPVDGPFLASSQSKVVLPPIHQPEEAAVDYLEKRNILSIFEELMNRVVMCLPADPLTFMIEHLRRRNCLQKTKQNVCCSVKALKPSYRVPRQYKPSPFKVESKPSAKVKTPSKTKSKKQSKSKSALNSKSTSSMKQSLTTVSEKLKSSSVIDKTETLSQSLVTSPGSLPFAETKSMSQSQLKKEPKSSVYLESSDTSVKERKLVSSTSLPLPKLSPKSMSSINLKLSSADQRQVSSEMDFNTFSNSHLKSSSDVDLESLPKEKIDDKKSSSAASKSKQKSLLLQDLESPIVTPASRKSSPVDPKSSEGAVEYSLKVPEQNKSP